jgi:hypothetical protein
VTSDNSDPLPEVLACSGLALEFCARPEIWPQFQLWLTAHGYNVSQEFTAEGAGILYALIDDVNAALSLQKMAVFLTGIGDTKR